jgi:succinate dehydrogenase hydrophobic anchor subunit
MHHVTAFNISAILLILLAYDILYITATTAASTSATFAANACANAGASFQLLQCEAAIAG